MTFKQKIYNRFVAIVDDRIEIYQKTLRDLTESAANETKSTAGDKHETALAMLQIEQENTGRQLKAVLQQKNILAQIDPTIRLNIVTTGSLIKTNAGYYFVSTALGKITEDRNTIIALSPQSPLCIKMSGLKAGDTFEINNLQNTIEGIE